MLIPSAPTDMTELPSNQTPENVLVEYATKELHLEETPKMVALRNLAKSADTNELYIEKLIEYQELGEIEANKQGEFRQRAQIGLTLISAGIKHSRGKTERYIEALEDAFVYAMNENCGDIQDKITEIEPSINRETFDMEQYFTSRM